MDKYSRANAVFSKFGRDYANLKKDLPIRPSEMAVLNIISRDSEKYTPVMIAKILGVSKSMVASLILVLENNGYIKRHESLIDKRSFYIIPTKKGMDLVNYSKKSLYKELENIEEKIGPEKFDLLIRLTEEVVNYLEEKKIGKNSHEKK